MTVRLAGTKPPKESLRSTLLWNTSPEGPACSLRPGHCGYGAAMALEETGKDAQDDENNTMAQTHLQVVFAADIEEAAAFELLNNLCHSSPEKLNFYDCSQIPSAAWQKLRGASWTNLREANFEGCLVLQTWLRCLASSNVKAIVTAVSLTAFDTIDRPNMWNLEMQSGRTWKSHLQEERQPIAILLSPQSSFEHSRCFHKDTKGADGAADLLEVLRNSPLEKLNFGECYEIPSAAWQKLRGASWTNLGEASFGWCLVLQTWLRCLASSLRHRVFFQC